MTKYLRSLVMGGRGVGGFFISTLRPCVTFMGKKKEENTPKCSSFKPAPAQAAYLQAEHSTRSSCLFFIFPWDETLRLCKRVNSFIKCFLNLPMSLFTPVVVAQADCVQNSVG
jgi:hypothetical protein